MIFRTGSYKISMDKLSAHPILTNQAQRLVVDTGKLVQSPTARDTIRTKEFIYEYQDYTFHCHTVSNIDKVV